MSDRVIDADVLAGIQSGTIKPCLFMLADFPSGTKYLWTGKGDIDWGGFTWVGVGGLISFSTFSETVDTAARGMKAKLNAMDSDLVANVVSEAYQGRQAIVYFGLFDAAGDLVVEPSPLWKGTLETDDVEDSGRTAELELSAEHRLTDILRKREIRYSDQDQQYLHPGEGDTGLNKMEVIQDVSVPWGKTQR